MTLFYLYLLIILSATTFTLAVMALARHRRKVERPDWGVSEVPADPELFTCIKADLKEVDQGVYLCQMRFANQGSLKFEVRSLKGEGRM
jgi:hypothetical protein